MDEVDYSKCLFFLRLLGLGSLPTLAILSIDLRQASTNGDYDTGHPVQPLEPPTHNVTETPVPLEPAQPAEQPITDLPVAGCTVRGADDVYYDDGPSKLALTRSGTTLNLVREGSTGDDSTAGYKIFRSTDERAGGRSERRPRRNFPTARTHSAFVAIIT